MKKLTRKQAGHIGNQNPKATKPAALRLTRCAPSSVAPRTWSRRCESKWRATPASSIGATEAGVRTLPTGNRSLGDPGSGQALDIRVVRARARLLQRRGRFCCGLGAFFAPRAERVAFADFQLLPEGASRGRLGAGRGVRLDGWYVKGVGRTQLAANWRVSKDTRHATGQHVSVVGGPRRILDQPLCRGERARRRDRPLRWDSRSRVSALGASACPLLLGLPHGEPIAAIDHRFQALSVKPDGFARFSVSKSPWAMHQLDSAHSAIADIALALRALPGSRAHRARLGAWHAAFRRGRARRRARARLEHARMVVRLRA